MGGFPRASITQERGNDVNQRFGIILGIISTLLVATTPTHSQEAQPTKVSYRGLSYPLYPATLDTCPDIPSPWIAEDGVEIVIGFRNMDSTYTVIPVTVENGDTLNYKNRQFGKGRQLEVDEEDFPTLARTGLHSETELDQTKTITGRPVEEITEDGRPGRSSFVGFMSHEEDIIGVLKHDNDLVKTLGLTHPQLAKPLFNLWNIILSHDRQMRLLNRPLQAINWFYYDGKKIHIIDAGSGHGWQESIFFDGILGMWQLEITRHMNSQEEAFLKKKYSHLSKEQIRELIRKLSYIHTGDMVPYYIMHYGFYEGHTSYRADPIAIAFIFGLRSIEDIEDAFEGELYRILARHLIAHD
jgi:hypothetical protein